MRAIDAVALSEGIELHRQATDQEYESDRQWAVGYNAGLDRALYSIAYAKTIAPLPNDPLTLSELREMGDDWIWIELLMPLSRMESGYYKKHEKLSSREEIYYGPSGVVAGALLYAGYGRVWLAYRHRPEATP